MCDQDHFENDKHEFEASGSVTRRQFGVLLGAGVAMLLPQVANAVTVTESDVNVTTPDGTADCYFVRPASGTAAAVLDAIPEWIADYNAVAPHSALGYRAPQQYRAERLAQV